MVVIRLIFVCLSFFASFLQASTDAQPTQNNPSGPIKLLIIDTAGQEKYYYRTMILLAQSVGFDVEFRNFYDIISHDKDDIISPYDAIFFMTSLSLLQNLKNDLNKKFIQILENLANTQNKVLGFFVPPTPRYSDMLFKITVAMIETIGIFKDTKGAIQKQAFLREPLYNFLKYLLQADAQKGAMYGTTLINKGEINMPTIADAVGQPFTTYVNPHMQEVVATLLPLQQDFSALIKKTLPSGMYLKNRKNNNIYFVSKVSEFTFADVAENFFKNPIHLEQRQELLMVAQQMLVEVYNAYISGTMQLETNVQRPTLPEELTLTFMMQEKERTRMNMKKNIKNNLLYDWIITQGISCAWEEPGDYFLHEDYALEEQAKKAGTTITDLQTQALQQGINFLYNADINLIWLECNPELYLSSIGIGKEKKAEFARRMTEIAIAIKKQFASNETPFPKIFIGTDITSNYRSNPVHQPANDLFNNVYTKIPSPLDFDHFWKTELCDIFKMFYEAFSATLPITGIFLDFEMYHAQHQTGAYTQLMDFSDTSWHIFCTKQRSKKAQELRSIKERIEYLKEHRAFEKYFSVLENAAKDLGLRIKKHLRAIKPDVIIGAYAPTLPSSWFYRGMFAGLSSPQEPLILATFNTDFYSHVQWLSDHNIHAIHGAPLLLSKFQSTQDFALIAELKKYHDFVWYLRPSRMVYPDKRGKWWSNESSPLDAKTLAEGIAHAQ